MREHYNNHQLHGLITRPSPSVAICNRFLALGGMRVSRQQRRRLGRSLKTLGKVPLDAHDISTFDEDRSAASGDVRLAAGRCAACLSTSDERKSCRACGFVRYCNRECQTAGWPSHKLVCRVLAADREIASSPKLSASATLLPLDTIWERLRGGGHAEAFEATAHLRLWMDRCGLPSMSDPLTTALRAEIAAAGGIGLLVAGLAAGGLRASKVAEALSSLALNHPETGAAIIAAGALPPLIYALALPSKHAGFGDLWSLCAAADDAADLIQSLGFGSPASSKAIAGTEGAIPALILHLKFVMREDAFPPPHWPAYYRGLFYIQMRAIGAISGLFMGMDADDENAASNAQAFIAGGVATLLASSLDSPDAGLAGTAAGCLARLLLHSQDADLARHLGGVFSKIADILRRGGSADREKGALLLDEVLRLAPEARLAADEAGALSAAASLCAGPADEA